MAWFIKDYVTDEVSGPLNDAQLKSLAASGNVTRNSEIAKTQDGPWYAAGKVNGLFAAADAVSPSAQIPVAQSISSQQPPPAATNGSARSVSAEDVTPTHIQAEDALFSVVWKLVRGAKEYSFHDHDFPALAACLRIGAVFARLWFCLVALLILLCGLILTFEPNPDGLAVWCSLTGDDARDFLVQKSDGLGINFSVFGLLWGIVRHCAKFLAIMGGMEFVRVILAIEKNTRRVTR